MGDRREGAAGGGARALLVAALPCLALLQPVTASAGDGRAAPAGTLAGAQAADPRPSEPEAALRKWIEDFLRRGRETTPDEERALDALLGDLRLARHAEPGRSMQVALALLELAALEPRRARSRSDTQPVEEAARRARVKGREAVRELLADAAIAESLARNVLALQGTPPERRVALLEAVAGRRSEPMLRGILEAAVAPEVEVRRAAWAALVRWPDPSVDRFFLLRAGPDGSRDPGLTWLQIREHFRGRTLPEDGAAAAELRALVTAGLLSGDWRRTVRALELAGSLVDGAVVPELIEALAVWLGRAERGQGSARVVAALMDELKRRIGVFVGPSPQRWAHAWSVRKAQEGQARRHEDLPSERTEAGFFGLRPMTDRVAFVVDRSGSMGHAMGFQSRSRYDEALHQMEQLLRTLGPATRFRLILFDHDVAVWSPILKPATDGNVRAARAWAAARGPRGGTVLRPAIEEVLRLKPDGLPDLARLEEDTVIVLCDGATEGGGWARGLLDRVNASACLVFHSVQIGAGGDGVLRELAELTGGRFVIVDP